MFWLFSAGTDVPVEDVRRKTPQTRMDARPYVQIPDMMCQDRLHDVSLNG